GGVIAVRIEELDAVDEEEQVTEAPATGVLEGQGLLLFRRGEFVVVAIQIAHAVVLPLQQFGVGLGAGQGGAAREQRGGKETGHEILLDRYVPGTAARPRR